MEIRRILVDFEPDGFSPDLAQCAVQLALRFEADLVGFSAAMPWPITAGPDYTGIAATIYAEQRADLDKRLSALEEQFHAAVPAGVKASWQQGIESPDRGLIAAGRSIDLALMGPGSGISDAILRAPDRANIVLSLGRPVLFVGAGISHLSADRVIVCWKDSRETRRAVVDALPFLKAASAVMVCAVEEGDFATAKPSLQDALNWMKSHDINAIGDIVTRDAAGLGATLEKARTDFRADLTVTGAYGHSRMREWLRGGMTEELLETQRSNHFMSS